MPVDIMNELKEPGMKNMIVACLAIALGLAVMAEPMLAYSPNAVQQGQTGNGPGGQGSSSANKNVQITWGLSKTAVAEALFSAGTVLILFQTSAQLKDVGFWLTPSLTEYLEVVSDPFPLLEPGTEYGVEIALKGDRPTKTIGGTLHLVPMEEMEDALRRTYPRPLPINVKFGVAGGEEDGPEGEQTIAVISSASYSGDAIAPLQLVSIFGFGIGPDEFGGPLIKDGRVTDYLRDVQVLFDGTAAPILFTSQGQLNVVVPSNVAGKSEVTVTITFRGSSWEITGVPVLDAIPEIFAMNGLGHGLAAALDSEGKLISAENPVAPGEVITFFGTGVGLWKDGFIDGTVVDPASLPVPRKPVEIMIGGATATALYIGGAPGMVSGVVQFNVAVPPAMPELDNGPGPATAHIIVTSGGHPSKASIFIYVAAAGSGD